MVAPSARAEGPAAPAPPPQGGAASPKAHDQDADPQKAKARQLFKDGTELVNKAQWSEALAAFEQSAKILPHPVTTYNIGACQRALGRYGLAKKNLEAALALGLTDTLAADAKGFVGEIDRVLVRLDVTVSPAEAALTVDGRPLEVGKSPDGAVTLYGGVREPGPGEPPPTDHFPLVLDPGAHVFVLARKGFADAVINRSFGPGAAQVLKLELNKLPGVMHIQANVAGAAVSLGKLDVGVAPLDLERPAGLYEVLLRNPGFLDYKTTVSLEAGQEVDLRANLATQQTPIFQRWWFWTAAAAVVAGVVTTTYFATRTEPAPTRPPIESGGLGWAVKVP
jgi:hypothetical protein